MNVTIGKKKSDRAEIKMEPGQFGELRVRKVGQAYAARVDATTTLYINSTKTDQREDGGWISLRLTEVRHETGHMKEASITLGLDEWALILQEIEKLQNRWE